MKREPLVEVFMPARKKSWWEKIVDNLKRFRKMMLSVVGQKWDRQ